ncbi:MAG: hypothetical protein DRO12_02035 [Thermoprotei archaeon]|nr:MAG: hypothetical protein DRO12_02035 [Thermoprotei archaeon]
MYKKHLSKKEKKELVRKLASSGLTRFAELFKQCEIAILLDYDKFAIYVADGVPVLFRRVGDDRFYPTLYILNVMLNRGEAPPIPSLVVDQGAVKPLLNGADVMAPGVTKFTKEFEEGEVVAVLEPDEKYFIVVGYALMSSAKARSVQRGKVVKNVHRLNDVIWRECLNIIKRNV